MLHSVALPLITTQTSIGVDA